MILGINDADSGEILPAFSDSFNRPNSTTLGADQKWLEWRGDWEIRSNTAWMDPSYSYLVPVSTPTTGPGGVQICSGGTTLINGLCYQMVTNYVYNPVAVIKTNTPNAVVQAGPAAATASTNIGWGLVFWGQDSNNYYIAANAMGTSVGYSCNTNPSVATLSGTTCVYPANYSATASTSYSCPSGGSLSGTTCVFPGNYAATGTPYSIPTVCEYDSSGGEFSGWSCNGPLTTDYTGCDIGNYGGCNCGASCQPWQCCGCNGCNKYTQYLGAPVNGSCSPTSGAPGGTKVGSACVTGLTACEFIYVHYYGLGTANYYERTCPLGGTLVGTKCQYPCTATGTTYSCPYGGSLSGTTCVFPGNYAATASTSYSCPTNTSVVSLSGTTCVYPASYTATSGTNYNHAVIIKKVENYNTVTAVAETNIVTTGSASVFMNYIQVLTNGTSIQVTGQLSNGGTLMSYTGAVAGAEPGKYFGIGYVEGFSAGSPGEGFDNFSYAPYP